jgi:DMSO/TMAO reductase YedYZ molybdopterin-dependent catalytic subunit
VNKPSKLVIILFAALIIIEIPLYIIVHPIDSPKGYLQIKGNVNQQLNMTLNEITTIQSVNLTAQLTSSGNPQENGLFNYTGVPLWSLLEHAGISENATSVYVVASDAYGTVLKVKEVKDNPKIVIAYMEDGEMIKSQSEGGYGPLRLIVGTDAFANRWVKWVVSITVN